MAQSPPTPAPPVQLDTAFPLVAPPLVGAATCIRCQFDLEGLSEAAVCPKCAFPVAPSLNRLGRAACIACQYPLRGLRDSGRCPECGTSVELSRFGVLLGSRGIEHLETLRFGIALVLAGYAVQLAIWLVFVFVGALDEATVEPFLPLIAALPLLSVLVIVMWMIGWWLFTAPDPRDVERTTASSSRRVVRAMIVTLAVILLATVTVTVVAGVTRSAGIMLAIIALPFVVLPVAIILTAVHFFASLAYINWLAARLPSEAIAKRARLLMWLAPVLSTVGFLVLVGPLISLALYCGLLERVRRQIKLVSAGEPSP